MMRHRRPTVQIVISCDGLQEVGVGREMSSPAGPEWNAALERIWLEHRELTLSRLATVRSAVEAAVAGTLAKQDELRRHGAREAHKLGGSLGAFGLQAATEAARGIERILEGSDAECESKSPQLRLLYDELAQAVQRR